MVLITTSRKPCRNTRTFARKLSNLIPNSIYLTRGKKDIYDLIEYARSHGLRRIMLIGDFRGNPGKVQFLKLGKSSWAWEDIIIHIKGLWTPEKKMRKIKAEELMIKGKMKKKFDELFSVESVPDADLILDVDTEKMVFELDGEKILKVKIKIKSEK